MKQYRSLIVLNDYCDSLGIAMEVVIIVGGISLLGWAIYAGYA